MKENLTQIAIVLDRSGSMATVREATIEAFNGYIKQQQDSGDDINLLFVQFDTEGPHDIVSDGKIKDAIFLNHDNYLPRGGTPLHDAIGWTVTELGTRLAKLPENERPGKVIVVILTDGQENSSREFNHESVAALIKQQTETYKWLFVFLAANQDAVLTASTYNIHAGHSLSYVGAAGMRSATGSASYVTDLWKYAPSTFDPSAVMFTDEDRIKAKQEDVKDVVGGTQQK